MAYNIKPKRLAMAMTQEELAKKSAVSRATISKLENGEEVEVKMTTLRALAQALDCCVADLF